MKLRVYKNQYGFSTLAKNGEDKMYIQIQFKKGTEPSTDTTDIIIKDAFFSAFKNKNGFTFPKLVILSYEVENKEEKVIDEYEFNIHDDILPF